MFIRLRMKRILYLLENKNTDKLQKAMDSGKYQRALKALSDLGCVQIFRNINGEIKKVLLLDHYATYHLERREVWINRIWGFIAGVLTTVAAHYVILLIGG